jgi:hypothetical protein
MAGPTSKENIMYKIRNVLISEWWWSNDIGWVDYDSADRFDEEEKDSLWLPFDGEWVAEDSQQKTEA